MSTRRAVIFANGFLPSRESARDLLAPSDFLIAADGGSHHMISMGLTPSVIIGDLDSLNEADRRRLESHGTTVIAYPRDKNETDLEMALQYALQQGFDSIRIVAALGGRMDQALGNLSLLTDPALAGRDIRLDDGVEQVFFVRDHVDLQAVPGDLVSLIPWGGEVNGISTRGLKWTLSGENLSPHKTRGISNEMLESTATVSIESGLLLIVHRRQLKN